MALKFPAIGIAAFIISFAIGQVAFADAFHAPGHPANVDGTIRLSFAPNADADNQVSYTLANATNQVLIMTGTIVNADFANMLIRMKKNPSRHMDIRIILDQQGLTLPGRQIKKLSDAGIPVYIDPSHIITDNIIITDARTVLTSSAPFTKDLTKSVSANIVVFPDQPLVADIYFKHWMAHFRHCVAYSEIKSPAKPKQQPQPKSNPAQHQSLTSKARTDANRAIQTRNQVNKYRIDLKHLF